jgi:hypothetical protein
VLESSILTIIDSTKHHFYYAIKAIERSHQTVELGVVLMFQKGASSFEPHDNEKI